MQRLKMKLWLYFIILIINNLVILLLTTELFNFDQSLNDTICIDRSDEIIMMEFTRIKNTHGETKVIYNVTSNSGVVDDGKRAKVMMKDNNIFELHINGNATLGNNSTLRLVLLVKDDFMPTSNVLTDSEDSQWNIQNSIKHFYDSNNNNQLTNKYQQQGYQFINPELDVQWFERNSRNSKPSALKRKRRLSVYSTIGSEYYIGFIPLFGFPPSLTVLSSSEQSINYTVEAPVTELYETGNIIPNVKNTINLPDALSGVSRYSPFCRNNSFKEGIYLQTSRDEITVIGAIREDEIEFNFDTFFAIPTKDFCIAEYTYFAISVDTFVAADGSIVIVGTADQTTMDISVPISVVIKLNNFDDWEPLEPGILYNFTIQRLDIVYIAAFTTDLTGTKVTTNKPISFFSGHECAFIPYTVFSCDHLAEQIPPTELWGDVHYFAPLANRSSYMIKIVAANDSTTVDIYCDDILTSHIINAGEFVNMTYDNQEFCVVYASDKVLVAQFSLSFYTDSQGDPMMTLIPATCHYTHSITSSTFNTSEQNVSYSNYINIIVLADYFQPEMISITTEKMNWTLDLEYWVPINRDNVTEAYAAQVEMPVGIFRVAHLNTSALMTVVVYGFTLYLDTPSPNSAEGYGHPGWLMDQLSIVVSLEQSEYSLDEEDGLLSVTIVMNDEPSQDFMVEVNVTEETATAGMDYNITTSVFNLTISAGTISSSFNIDIINDETLEDNEVFNIAIKLIPTTLQLTLCISSTTVTIIDHDEIRICFNEPSVRVMEDQESATFLPALTNPSSHDITIIVDTADGTAVGGDDYEPGPFNITIPAGEISIPFNISIIDDSIFEGNELFNLIIYSQSLPHRLSLKPNCMAMITIVDDDALIVSFDNETYIAYENVGMIRLLLFLSDPSPFVETVQVMNTDITANGDGIDYDSGPYNVTFSNGSTNATLDIIMINDGVLEGDEMFNVTITSITNGHIVGTPAVATVTIIDTTTKKTASITATVVGGGLGGTVLLVLLVVVIIMCCVIRANKKKKKQIWNDRVYFSKSSFCVIPDPNSNNNMENQRRRESSAYLFEELKKQHESCLIDNCKLIIGEKIAKGNFGVVHKGWYDKENMQVRVAVKTLTDVSSINATQFIKECVITSQFDHPNVLSLIGVCVNIEDGAIHMVMPFMVHGDIRSYLRAKRGSAIEFDHFPEGVRFELLMNMCLEIAKGMEYLSSKHFVHRDLAARNCMLDENMGAKVADFGLSRDVYMSNYYVMSQKVPLPVKWLAPEALMDKVFSEKTDVWAYGVTCWEIFSLGLQPYPSVDPHEMGDYLKSRRLLEKPSLCSDEFYNIMKSCWIFKPEDRPNFMLLVENVNQQIQLTEQQRYKKLTSSYLRVYN